MKEQEFIRVFGLDIARMAISECTPECDLDTVYLKRLVESHKLVESVPRGYEGLKSRLDYCDPKFCLFHSEKYKQAIADVESCQ